MRGCCGGNYISRYRPGLCAATRRRTGCGETVYPLPVSYMDLMLDFVPNSSAAAGSAVTASAAGGAGGAGSVVM